MNYNVEEGLLKEGSLSAKIYFLLLIPKTKSEVSRIIYNGKIQLSNISKNIEDLEKAGFVHNEGRRLGSGKNFNQIYYKSNLKPIINMIKERSGERKSSSKSKNRKELTEEEIIFIEDFLTSKWFSQFYEQDYLRDDLECEKVGETYLCSVPVRFFAFLLEEIFVIRQTMQQVRSLFEKEIIEHTNFDDYIIRRQKTLDETAKRMIKNIFNNAKTGYLGNYASTNRTIDKYLKDYGVLFLPYELSTKLSALGRVPLTIAIAFNNAIEKEFNRID